MTHYTLVLPLGAITYGNNRWRGDTTEGTWHPANPNTFGGLNDGDIVTITCTFNYNPDVTPLPPAREYYGLAVGSCSATDQPAINGLKRAIGGTARAGGLIRGGHMTESQSPSASDIFYKAVGIMTPSVALTPSSRGTIPPLYYQWTMTYNGNNNVVTDGSNVEIVFGYGDPHVGENDG